MDAALGRGGKENVERSCPCLVCDRIRLVVVISVVGVLLFLWWVDEEVGIVSVEWLSFFRGRHGRRGEKEVLLGSER